jgi:hypothetical protein
MSTEHPGAVLDESMLYVIAPVLSVVTATTETPVDGVGLGAAEALVVAGAAVKLTVTVVELAS